MTLNHISGDEAPQLPPVTLFRTPPALSLPSADPHALAVECMLRFAGAHYVKRDAAFPVTVEIRAGAGKGGDKSAVQRFTGLSSCFQLVETSVHLDVEAFSRGQKPLLRCVKILVERALLPAFVYIIHSDVDLFNNTICKGVVPKVGTVWQRMLGTYRSDILERTTYCGRYHSVTEALEEVQKGLLALEDLYVANAKADAFFFLGTERPCSADALVYAAVSSFLHADFAGSCALDVVVKAQLRMRGECPELLKYVEKLRVLYFEDYAGFYTLRATNMPGQAGNVMDLESEMFRKGRVATLAWTIGFAAVYFLCCNVQPILASLADYPDEDEEMEDGEELEGKSMT